MSSPVSRGSPSSAAKHRTRVYRNRTWCEHHRATACRVAKRQGPGRRRLRPAAAGRRHGSVSSRVHIAHRGARDSTNRSKSGDSFSCCEPPVYHVTGTGLRAFRSTGENERAPEDIRKTRGAAVRRQNGPRRPCPAFIRCRHLFEVIRLRGLRYQAQRLWTAGKTAGSPVRQRRQMPCTAALMDFLPAVLRAPPAYLGRAQQKIRPFGNPSQFRSQDPQRASKDKSRRVHEGARTSK